LNRTPRSSGVTTYWLPGLVLAAGVGMLLYLGEYCESPELVDSSVSTLILWLTLVAAAAISPIPLPRAEASVSVAPALEFAGTLIFGPLVGCWIAVLGSLVSNAVNKWNPLPVSLTRLGQSMLAVGATGIVYMSLGGRFAIGVLETRDQLLPVVAAAATYLAVKSSIAALSGFLNASRASNRPWWMRVGVVAGMETLVMPFGVLLAVTQVRIGPIGVALFLIPLILARYSFRLWNESRTAHLETVRTLMSAIDAADPFTWGLSYRVSKLSLRVGRHLGLSDREIEELEYAALLHDIGRTAIKRDILLKTGRLTEKEQASLRTHPRVGSDILSRLHFFPGAAELVHCHHEQPDGSGYPRGLARSEIPVGSRIIMAVAAFDAMTSDRPYRRGLSPEAAFDELLRHSGTQFFPDVVEALSQLYAQNRLFEEFEPDMLAAHADGQGVSQAITEYLRRTGATSTVPGKLGVVGDPVGEVGEETPRVELPAAPPEPVYIEKEIVLDDGGLYRLVVAGMSDVGCVRSNNEDSFGVFAAETPRKGCLMVLADGMGGAAAGEVASRLAVDAVTAHYLADRRRHRAQESMRTAIQEANRSVHERSLSGSGTGGMGTTCTAAGISGNSLVVGHVGDSRAYIVRPRSIEQITADHTLAAELRDAGRSGTAVPQSAHHVLTRCLGSQADVQVDVTGRVVRLDAGDAVVLCSDGLPAVVEDDEICQIVSSKPPRDACRGLVELARSRGGPDNVTVLVGLLKAA
jgi:serine/threonine protein phosphatase PrpC